MSHADGRAPVRAVVFDFDGVIADTERLHLAAFQQVFASRGWTLSEDAYFDRYLGFDDAGLVGAYLSDEALDLSDLERAALVSAKTEIFRRHLNSPAILFPSAQACIATLAAEFRLAIASGALHHEIEAILVGSGLRELFGPIVASDDVPVSKPAPDPYLAAAAALGVQPASCVAIEDSPAGLEAARTAGMRTVAITTTSPRNLLARADRIIEDLRELTPEMVRGL
jgi:beta-phosphoglucomutase